MTDIPSKSVLCSVANIVISALRHTHSNINVLALAPNLTREWQCAVHDAAAIVSSKNRELGAVLIDFIAREMPHHFWVRDYRELVKSGLVPAALTIDRMSEEPGSDGKVKRQRGKAKARKSATR